MKLFHDVVQADFIDRPNRFTLHCRLNGKTVKAYLPNPGRLWEILLPGVAIYLERQISPQDRMPFTAVAIQKDGRPVMVHTHKANDWAQYLLERNLIPGLEGIENIQREVPMGRSRFDFLLERGKERIFLEVKSCTLFGEKVAMFPDAVTDRGRRHLEELADLKGAGISGAVLFLVGRKDIQLFLPEYHTDPAFSRTLLTVKNRLPVIPLAVQLRPDSSPDPETRVLPIPWAIVEREGEDRGSYLLLLRLSRGQTIEVGKLGSVRFPKGYYIYVGSARKNLCRRMARHRRLRKTHFWHIDDLRAQAEWHNAIPIRTADDLECNLAEAVKGLAEWEIPRFGASDCRCSSHLYGMKEDPLQSSRFISLLQYFRMDRLVEKLPQAPF